MPRIEFIPLDTSESPQETLEWGSPSLHALRIRAGWEYDLATACIIVPPDDPGVPFDGGVEYAFVAHLIYEKLMFMRPVDDDGCEDVSLPVQCQVLVQEGERYYDVLTFQVSARPKQWPDPVFPRATQENAVAHRSIPGSGSSGSTSPASLGSTHSTWLNRTPALVGLSSTQGLQ